MAVRGEGHDVSANAGSGARADGARSIDGRRHVGRIADTPDGEIETLAIEQTKAWRVRTPKLPISPNGTGDLFAALFTSARVQNKATPEALGHAASAIYAVLERTAARGTEEMRIVESGRSSCIQSGGSRRSRSQSIVADSQGDALELRAVLLLPRWPEFRRTLEKT